MTLAHCHQSDEKISALVAINASIIVSLALITKNHLLAMWSLSEELVLRHNDPSCGMVAHHQGNA